MLTKDLFDALLEWLDPDRENAGQQYNKIQLRLIRLFQSRGCNDAEDLADEVIDRVASKVKDLSNYEGERDLYFYGVARNVHLEDLRRSCRRREILEYLRKNLKTEIVLPLTFENGDESEADHLGFEECMQALSPMDRFIAVEYYRAEKRVRIRYRSRVAEKLGLTIGALRIKACRIRKQLRKCIEQYVNEIPAH